MDSFFQSIKQTTKRISQSMELECTDNYDVIRLMAIREYLMLLLRGTGMMIASENAAKFVMGALRNTSIEWLGRRIRLWSKHFVRSGDLCSIQHGRHRKCESLIQDEDVRDVCVSWLRNQVPSQRRGHSFAKFVSEFIFPRFSSSNNPVCSERTARR